MRTYGLFALVLLSLVLGACRPPADAASNSAASGASSTDGLRVRIETEEDASVGPSPVRVYLLQDGEGVSGAEVEVTGTMTHAGMSPVIVQAQEQEPGLYRAEDFEFTMSGDWILIADITLPDGSQEQAETTLTVSGG